MSNVEFIRKLREARPSVTVVKCKEIAEQVGYDFDKAVRIADGLPAEPDEYERYDNLPFYSKEPTDDHPQDVRCPHCDKDFYCKGFGAYA